MVGRVGRNHFTDSDDDHLIKYIAKVKPTVSGRQGNNLYMSLEESVGQRPWANRHTWQSWRERYRKNQDWFNYHIKKYQKKLKEDANETKTEDRDELYAELFGISQFSEDGEDDEADVHKRSLAPSSFNDIQQPAPKPATSSGQKSPTAAATIPLKPPQLSEYGGDQSDVPKRSLAPSSFDGVQEPTSKPASKPATKPATFSGQKSSAPIAPKPSQLSEDGGDESDVHKILLAPSFDDVVKIETIRPAQEPASKPTTSSGQKSSAATAEIALKPPRQYTKSKKIVSRDDDSKFFGTPSLSPSPSLLAANSTPRGAPPTLTQGSYRSSFKRPRAAFGNVTNDESWPPKRRKKMAKDSDVTPDVEMSDAYGRIETNKASLPIEGSTNGVTRLRPPAQVNAVASSSKVLLSDPPHRPAKPTNLLKVIYAKSDTSHVHTDAPSLPKAIQDTNLPFVKKNHDGSVTGSSSQNSVPIKSVHRLINSPDDDVDHQLARLSSVDIDDDPFITNKPTTTSPVRNFILPPRRIDLRKSLDATRNRRSRTSTTTSSVSRHSNNLSFLPEDREIFNQAGFQKVMAVIAKNYGFDVDVAMKAFFATKSIEKTKSLLQFAKEVTNSATSALLSKLVNDDDINSSDDDEAPRSMRRGGHNNSSPPSGKDQQRNALTNSGRQSAKKRSLGGSRRKSNRLSIKLRPFDEEINETFSDYSPPRVSRAGQFLRLVKEGRREEAVDRERRRASGAFVIQTQTQAQRYDDEDHQQSQQSSLSRMPNSSPTHNSPDQKRAVDKIDTCNVDSDIQPTIVGPHKEDIVIQQHHDQPPDNDDISLPVDDNHHHHHRIFFKRISEGQSSLNEDEDNPEVLKLAKEHRDLVMNVTEDNAEALRSFEQKNNQDLLRLWSLDWVKQKIADM